MILEILVCVGLAMGLREVNIMAGSRAEQTRRSS